MTGCDKVVLLQEASPTLPQEVKTVLTAAKKLGTVQHTVPVLTTVYLQAYDVDFYV